MSFSTKLKSELLNDFIIANPKYYPTFLNSILKYKGEKVKDSVYKIETYNFELAKVIAFILKTNYSQNAAIKIRNKRGIEPDNLIQLTFKLSDEIINSEFISDFELVDFAALIVLYGYFVDPQKYYSFELKLPIEINKTKVLFINQLFKITLKKLKNKNVYYIKDGEEIANIILKYHLNNSLFIFEDIRIMKDMRNNYNRQDNFYIANEVKKQSKIEENIKIIKIIEKNQLIRKNLTEKEKLIIQYRKEYQEASLAELVKVMQENGIKISKTAISNFFTKYKNF